MFDVSWVYGVCFFVGLVYMILSWIFGGLLGGGEGGVDAGADVHVDIGDVGGHLEFSPLSPTVIASFVGGFGGGGYIAKETFKLDMPYNLFIALGTGLTLGGLMFFILLYMFRHIQTTSTVRQIELVGTEAQVTITIPVDGLGEISFTAFGKKINAPARIEEHKPIPSGSVVVIDKIVGNIYYVKEKNK